MGNPARLFMAILAIAGSLAAWIPPASALPDEDHEFFMTRLDYASSDKMLNRVWSDLKKSVPPKTYGRLLKNQKDWILDKRDREVLALQKVFPYLDDCSCYFMANLARTFLLEVFLHGIRVRHLVAEPEIEALFYSLDPVDCMAEILANVNIKSLHPYNRGGKFRPAGAAPRPAPGPAANTVLQSILDTLNELRR